METNNKVVEVINVLCDKLGVAIDWTSENVLPYVQDLMGRFIKMEIATSIFWICFVVGVLALASCFVIVCSIKAKDTWSEYDFGIWNVFAIISYIILGLSLIATLVAIPQEAMDIIECTTLPEKVFIEYIINATK